MTIGSRPGVKIASLVLLAAVAMSATAWACIPQARLVSLRPSSYGPAGEDVTVDGLAFDEGPVEIRWATPDGELLAATAGPTFSETVRVPPDAREGLYSIIVLSRGAGGSVGNASAAAFQVTTPGSAESASSARGQESSTPAGDAGSPDGTALQATAGLVLGGLFALALSWIGGFYFGRRRPTSP